MFGCLIASWLILCIFTYCLSRVNTYSTKLYDYSTRGCCPPQDPVDLPSGGRKLPIHYIGSVTSLAVLLKIYCGAKLWAEALTQPPCGGFIGGFSRPRVEPVS